ncbi:uncharacterized protein LOC141863541 isoform X3 [Acropora palmata]|uniref:uncharacterized protein LOC141863541 isoform X3 n=1 Tax=Acropora palmata TaxID=6131 RepID=UPI003DA0B209
MELSPRSQQNPPELEVIGEQSTPRSTDQDSEENQCQTSVFREPLVAENKKCAVEHEHFTDLPGGEEKEKDRDGSSQEQMEVDNTEQCHGPFSCVEPSTASAKKQRTAEKKKCATEHMDVTHLPGGEKDRDGIVPDRVKDKDDDLDSSQEKKPWAAEKKKCATEHADVTHHSFKKPWTAKKKRCATEHVDVTHLPGGEKDRDGFSLENVEVDNGNTKDKDKEDDLDAFQEKMEVGPSFALAKPWAAEKKKCATEHADVTHHSFKKPWTAKKKRCATEHVDVTHLPGGEKDRDGFSLENVEVDNGNTKDKDKEDDLDAFQEKMEVGPSFALAKNPWGAEKKNAVQHEDVTHLLGEEKEEEDRNGFFQENKEVDNTEQCYKPSTAQAKQQQRQQQQQLQQQLQLHLQQPASHPQPGTTSSQPQPPFRRIYQYPNHALWFFPPNISQSKFEGRTSSNACTFIALLMGKLFSVTRNATVNIRNETSSPQVWLRIVSTAIREGNRVHDDVTGGEAINFSVDEAIRDLDHDGCIGKTELRQTLDVGFANEDSHGPQASLSCHLGRLSHEASNIAALVIVNEMTICFVARGEKLFVLDSHSHPPFGGAMVGVSDMSSRESFLATIKQILGLQHNLCSISFVEYL